MQRELPYSILDVFAEAPFEGNALAVVHDARGLTDEAMQTLARETNLSETTFLFPEDDPERDRREGMRVRIFTTQEELPFAGHPTLGTASWLHLFYPPLQGAPDIRLRLKAGTIPVHFEPRPDPHFDPRLASRLDPQSSEARDPEARDPEVHSGFLGVFATMRQQDPIFGEEHDPGEVAAILGLGPGDLLDGVLPQTVSTGNAFCLVALRSLEVLGRLAIPQREAAAWLRARRVRWFYCVAPTGRVGLEEPTWRARMQFYGGEDPATGSAAGPCIAWLVRLGLAPSGQAVLLEQGIEISRPSRLTLRATKVAGGAAAVLVGGRTIPVATGRFFLPVHGRFTQAREP